jgi:peroxiredoxin Q/BCP
MVELRKRKTPPSAPAPPAKKKAAPKESKVSKAKAAVAEQVEAVKEAVIGTSEANGESAPPASAPKVGDTIDLSAFGAEVETHDGVKTSFAQILEQSESGVVLFTYPKASTPGCKCKLPSPELPLATIPLTERSQAPDKPVIFATRTRR